LAFAQFPHIWLLGLHAANLKIRPSRLFNPGGHDLVTFQTTRGLYWTAWRLMGHEYKINSDKDRIEIYA